jgi:hypothetical protein
MGALLSSFLPSSGVVLAAKNEADVAGWHISCLRVSGGSVRTVTEERAPYLCISQNQPTG